MTVAKMKMALALVLCAVGPASAGISSDELIAEDCATTGIDLPELAGDSTYLRRVYLDAVGRIPTLQEARAFLDSPDTNKRELLIDSLLGSEGYAQH